MSVAVLIAALPARSITVAVLIFRGLGVQLRCLPRGGALYRVHAGRRAIRNRFAIAR